jgi:osmotically-inducible protein OsmY
MPPDTTGTADTGTSVPEGTVAGTPAEPKTTTPEMPTTTTPAETPAEQGQMATSTPGEAVGTATDTALVTAIKDKLSSTNPPAPAVDVAAQDGVVTLKGNVSSQAEADRLVSLIKGIPNVKDVVSELKIASQ